MSRRITFQESDLLDPLIDWLTRQRKLLPGAALVPEFPWQGRFVDLVLLSKSQITFSFELKLSHTRRALHQAALNLMSFDRNLVVTASRPTAANLDQARNMGIGVILLNPQDESCSALLSPRPQSVLPIVRKRLRESLTARSLEREDVC